MEDGQLNKLRAAQQSKNCLQHALCSCSVGPKLVHAQMKEVTNNRNCIWWVDSKRPDLDAFVAQNVFEIAV